MSPFHDMGRILRDVYEQHQRQPQSLTQDKQTVPRLAGGLWGAFGFEEAAAIIIVVTQFNGVVTNDLQHWGYNVIARTPAPNGETELGS